MPFVLRRGTAVLSASAASGEPDQIGGKGNPYSACSRRTESRLNAVAPQEVENRRRDRAQALCGESVAGNVQRQHPGDATCPPDCLRESERLRIRHHVVL